MDTISLIEELDKISGAKVLCVGDVMLDQFVYGSIARISPEAPVPVLSVEKENSMLGGAGNVARNLSALGAQCLFFGVVGGDLEGQKVRGLLDELSNTKVTLLIDQRRPTTVKQRFISSNQQVIRVDREITEVIDEKIENELLQAIFSALPDASVLVLSDYDKGTLSVGMVSELIKAAKTSNIPVIVDPKGEDYSRYAGASLITPNSAELKIASQAKTESDTEVTSAAEYIRKKFKLNDILVTRSAKGMTLVESSGPTHFPAAGKEVFDVSGAGDTVVATLGAALAGGISLNAAVRLANVAAGVVVSKSGTAVASQADITSILNYEKAPISSDGKRVSLAEAVNQIQSWRIKGDKICFTNGCFDLIHPGHISMLSQSRRAGDRLVVGLNSDESVKKLKGKSRPIQNEISRAKILSALSSVDLVVIFSDETPIELIKSIKPEVLTKGADYSMSEVVGSAFVESYGGEVKLIDIEDAHSTTATVNKISES
ncbi:MAG: D-glycero-beta-D-manno-heptose-7-phosphate kinase [Rhodospirillaceae bacterium]